jgi:hypothetical protein
LLRTVCALRREEVGRLPAAAAKRWLATERMRWNDFATPRQLLGELAAAGGLDLSGLQQVPHDLWAGTDLPPLPLVDRVSLILIQFDLTFQLADDGNRAALIPIPERVAIVRAYPGGPQPEILVRKWAALAPESEVRVSGEKIWVRGPLEDQEKIAAARRGVAAKSSRKPLVRQGETRFTVNGKKGPLDRMLGELADKLDLELRIDKKRLQQAGVSLTQEVSFQVKNATLDELLDAVLAPAGCTFRRQGKIVEVIPAR